MIDTITLAFTAGFLSYPLVAKAVNTICWTGDEPEEKKIKRKKKE